MTRKQLQAKEWYERARRDPSFAAKRRRVAAEHYESRNPGVVKRREQRDAKREFVGVIKALNSRLVEQRVQRGLLAAAAKRVMPLRKVLTEDERRERVRQDKRAYRQRRRARLRSVGAALTARRISELEARAGGICHYCGCEPDYLTLDHVVPLAAGGAHTEDNVVFACHPCNSLKRDLSVEEFLPLIGK